MKKLHKIWKVVHNVDDYNPIYSDENFEYDAVAKTLAYPLLEVLSVLPWLQREDVISMDLVCMQESCDYLNELADDNVHYEIRSLTCSDAIS